MKTLPLLKSMLLMAVGATLLTGCVVRERRAYRPAPAVVVSQPVVSGEVVVTEAPPPPRVERVTVAPAPGYLWIGGNWAWHGRWVWERGHWDRPPHPGAVWVPHRYEYRNGVHVFISGGWR